MFGIIEFNPLVDENRNDASFPITIGRLSQTTKQQKLSAVVGVDKELTIKTAFFTKRGLLSTADVNDYIRHDSYLNAVTTLLLGSYPRSRFSSGIISYAEHFKLRTFNTRKELSSYLYEKHRISLVTLNEQPETTQKPSNTINLPAGQYQLSELYAMAHRTTGTGGQVGAITFNTVVPEAVPETISDAELHNIFIAIVNALPRAAAECIFLRDNGRLQENAKNAIAAARGNIKQTPIKLHVEVR